MKRTALISVSDRTGLEEFARGLVRLGFELLTTSGSGAFLKERGIESLSIEAYTGQAEIFGGRVKTLHPKIYAGILARRDVPEDTKLLEKDGIRPIEVVAVNLYPFREALGHSAKARADHEMIELIDIGGPSMIRAAAKNHDSVLPIIDPSDYSQVLTFLEGKAPAFLEGKALAGSEKALRRDLAAKVFATLADDGVAVASYMSGQLRLEEQLAEPRGQGEQACSGSSETPAAEGKNIAYKGIVLRRERRLRYGENPHQTGEFCVPMSQPFGTDRSNAAWRVHGGKVLSYNNLLDCDAMVRLLQLLDGTEPTAAIIKHLNPCGAARGISALAALQSAKRSDPRSHFGGIIGFTCTVTKDAAEAIREDFAEVVVAPAYEPEALALLLQNKNLRVLEIDLKKLVPAFEVRSVLDGYLVQSPDREISGVQSWEQAARGKGVEKSADLDLAWRLCSQVKSNAIVLVKDGILVGVGAGQMSRVDSVEVALHKARLHEHDLTGAVAASDAFFPFPDGIELLLEAGITHVVAPKGAKRDADVIAAAEKYGAVLYFAGERHFRH
jgi:phosphoribosylaminoimidazolecarboxamide formyltransferase/IMP cyclohydrolase